MFSSSLVNMAASAGPPLAMNTIPNASWNVRPLPRMPQSEMGNVTMYQFSISARIIRRGQPSDLASPIAWDYLPSQCPSGLENRPNTLHNTVNECNRDVSPIDEARD